MITKNIINCLSTTESSPVLKLHFSLPATIPWPKWNPSSEIACRCLMQREFFFCGKYLISSFHPENSPRFSRRFWFFLMAFGELLSISQIWIYSEKTPKGRLFWSWSKLLGVISLNRIIRKVHLWENLFEFVDHLRANNFSTVRKFIHVPVVDWWLGWCTWKDQSLILAKLPPRIASAATVPGLAKYQQFIIPHDCASSQKSWSASRKIHSKMNSPPRMNATPFTANRRRTIQAVAAATRFDINIQYSADFQPSHRCVLE